LPKVKNFTKEDYPIHLVAALSEGDLMDIREDANKSCWLKGVQSSDRTYSHLP